MIKKIFIASAICVISSTTVNAGPYVGLSVSNNIGSWQIKDMYGVNNKVGARGSMATFFAGFGNVYRAPMYVGGEVFANTTSSQSATKHINNITGKIKQTYSYGVSVMPGVMLGQSAMVYGRLGYVKTRFQVRTNVSTNNTVLGTQFGLGLQGTMSDGLDLRGEYTYTGYRSLTAFNKIFNPSNSQFTVGLVYKFD